jgi:hypothetical protein
MPSDKAEICPLVVGPQIKLFWCLKMERQPESETTPIVFIQTTKEDQITVFRELLI